MVLNIWLLRVVAVVVMMQAVVVAQAVIAQQVDLY